MLEHIKADVERGIWRPPKPVVSVEPDDPTFLEFASDWWASKRKQELAERSKAHGIRDGLLFARRDGGAWRLHDYQNWRRRIWHSARSDAGIESLPPYDLRHAFASLQIRAGVSIPELAEQMGHSPQMTLSTYAHVIRELKGEPVVSAEEQIVQARRKSVRTKAG